MYVCDEDIYSLYENGYSPNGIVSYDIAEYIMLNDDIREKIRLARDKQGASPNWEDFIKNFIK